MKKKLLILGISAIAVISFFSFKSSENETSGVALVSAVKGDEEGYLIIYGDGTAEKVPCEMKNRSGKNALLNIQVISQIINKLHEKDYRYIGSHETPNSTADMHFTYMIFEKK